MNWLLNIVSNYLKFLINMVIVFFMTPFIIKMLGVEQFGLWSLIFAVIGLFGLLDLGFATAAVKFVAEAVGARNNNGLDKIVSSLVFIYLAIGAICLVLVFLLSGPFSYFFELDEHSRHAFTTVMIIVGSAVSLSFPLSIFKAMLIGTGHQVYVNAAELLMSLANAGLIIYFLKAGFGLQGLALSTAMTMVGGFLILIPFARRYVPHIKISFAGFSIPQLRELMGFSVYAFIANIAVLIILRIDPLVIGLFMPLSAIAIYAISAKVSEYSYLLNKQFSNALMPLVSQAKGGENAVLIQRILLDGSRYLLALAVPFLLLLFIHTPAIINLWVGEDFIESADLLRILLVAVLFTSVQLNAANVLGMTGYHRFVAFSMAASALLNLLLSLVLIQFFGLTGVAVATLVAAFIVEMLVIIPRAVRVQNISLKDFLAKVIWPVMPAVLPMLIIVWGLNAWQQADTIGWVVLQSFIAGLVYLLAFYFTGMKTDERQMVSDKIARFRSKQAS